MTVRDSTFTCTPEGATVDGEPVPDEVARAILGPVADRIFAARGEPQRAYTYTLRWDDAPDPFPPAPEPPRPNRAQRRRST